MITDRKIRPGLAIPIVVILLSALFITNWPFGFYFLAEALNTNAVAAAWILIAVSVIFVPVQLRRKWTKVLASVLAGLVVLAASASVFLSIAFDGMVGYDLLQEIPYGDCTLRLYRGNGGATTSFWLVVREECEYLDMIQTRREYLSHYRAYEGAMTLSSEGVLKLEIEPYGSLPARSISTELED